MKKYEKTVKLLKSLKLRGIIDILDEEISESENQKISYLSFLNNLMEKEFNFRIKQRIKRNLTGAHFPILKRLEDFKYKYTKGILKSEVASLLDFRWIDNHENILFFGPPGIGKTHCLLGLGIKAVEAGYKVCFEKVTSLIKLLKTIDIQRKSKFRINKILSSNLVLIDEIGYTPIERKEANLFFNLISELYEKTSIIITSNKGFDEWAEMMGDEIMTTAMLDRLLHHSKVFNLSGESYRTRFLQKDSE